MFTKLLQRFRQKPFSYFSIVGLIVVAVFIPTHFARSAGGVITSLVETIAGTPLDWVLSVISGAAYYIEIYLMGELATVATKTVVLAANFVHFTDLSVIVEAWKVVRDLTNMFFIVILLVIAFGTLFRIEAYSWKKLLPKMILAAILVNYSRAICGVIVDAAQVVTLTFASAISEAADVSIVKAFQLDKILQYGTSLNNDSSIQSATISNISDAKKNFLAIMAAGAMLTVLVFVQFAYAVVLIARLAFIWFLTVLSPLAFATMVLPATEKYAKQWWDMFSRYVTVGPMILFFLWLSMYIAAKTSDFASDVSRVNYDPELANEVSTVQASGAMQPSTIAGFVVATMMLMAGLKIAQDSSSEVGAQVGKAVSAGKWLALGAVVGGTWKSLRGAGEATANVAADRMYAAGWGDFNLKRVWERGKERLAKVKHDRETTGRYKSGQKAIKGSLWHSLTGASDIGVEHFMPVLGKGGFLLGATSFRARKANAKAYDKAEHAEEHAKDELEEAEKKQFGQYYTQDQVVNHMNRRDAMVDDLNNSQWYTAQETDSRAMMEELKERKTKEMTEAKAEGQYDKANSIKKEIDDINVALEQGGENGEKVTISGDLKVHLNEMIKEKQDRFREEMNKKRLWKPEDHEGKTLNDYVADTVKTQRQAYQQAAAKKKLLVDQLSKEAPVLIDDQAESLLNELVHEQKKKLGDEANEDILTELLRSKQKVGDGIGYAAVFQHMTDKGHHNEALKAYGLDQNNHGQREFVKIMEKIKGLNHHMAMAMMNEAMQKCREIDQWVFAEGITQKYGHHEWRDEDERNARLYHEMGKRGANNIIRSGTRFAAGGYERQADGSYRYQAMAPAIALFAKAAPNLADLLGKNMAGDNLVKHLFDGDGIEKLFKDMAKKFVNAIRDTKETDGGKAYIDAKKGLDRTYEKAAVYSGGQAGLFKELVETQKAIQEGTYKGVMKARQEE